MKLEYRPHPSDNDRLFDKDDGGPAVDCLGDEALALRLYRANELHDDLMKLLNCAELCQDDLEPATRELLTAIHNKIKDLP